jgi:predicted HAD superfamily Cof-like phosphohydrolase
MQNHMSEFVAVCEFMNTAGQVINIKPINLQQHADVVALRRALIVEEVKELAAALAENDNIEIVDALIDILYVTWGAYAALGLQYQHVNLELNISSFISDLLVLANIHGMHEEIAMALNSIIALVGQYCELFHVNRAECFKAVHENNMTKFCDTIEEAEMTMAKYSEDTRYVGVCYVKKNNKYVVLDGKGKVLKSANYKPVILRNVIKFC